MALSKYRTQYKILLTVGRMPKLWSKARAIPGTLTIRRNMLQIDSLHNKYSFDYRKIKNITLERYLNGAFYIHLEYDKEEYNFFRAYLNIFNWFFFGDNRQNKNMFNAIAERMNVIQIYKNNKRG